ncbi:glutathione S-transferase N-terminal domain-containing protein [Caballeronia sp. NK8]|uniref:glutathione S-transferase family protein n=1 Tax=Caballeronia sp. NK8 TaxID=140098 RepID=UPI001BB5C72C|nr:glutathione S-transferase family protein [Caballeronia sp. NK8]BCQ24947.1 glutathione S-transferase N-terminal domain-containing protein [Caballeronia sp. NK8]
MILIGQYDSPFVRRVAIALKLYDIAYEHRPWSVFGDADKIAPFNPLIRVPTLVLDSGDVLIESTMILDYLDEQAGAARVMIAPDGPLRREALKVCALATGLADKAVALVYERVLHKERSQKWLDRCTGQVERVLNALEADRAARATPYWFGDAIGHADITVACALRFAREAHPELFSSTRWPTLIGHSDRCETLPVFRAIVQPFNPPK